MSDAPVKTTVLVTDIARTANGQRVKFTRLIAVHNQRLRVRIESDSYVDQTFGVIEVWTERGWSEIWFISHEAMATPTSVGYWSDWNRPAIFIEDCDKLVNIALDVLS